MLPRRRWDALVFGGNIGARTANARLIGLRKKIIRDPILCCDPWALRVQHDSIRSWTYGVCFSYLSRTKWVGNANGCLLKRKKKVIDGEIIIIVYITNYFRSVTAVIPRVVYQWLTSNIYLADHYERRQYYMNWNYNKYRQTSSIAGYQRAIRLKWPLGYRWIFGAA